MTLSHRVCQPGQFFVSARTGPMRLLRCRQKRFRHNSMRSDFSPPKRQGRLTAGIARLFAQCCARLAPSVLAAFLIGSVCLGTPSQAGVYTVSYSGGSTFSSSGSAAPFSLQQSGWTGGASAGGYSSANAQVNGTITATFTWQPDPSLPSDPPPGCGNRDGALHGKCRRLCLYVLPHRHGR